MVGTHWEGANEYVSIQLAEGTNAMNGTKWSELIYKSGSDVKRLEGKELLITNNKQTLTVMEGSTNMNYIIRLE